MPPNPGRVLGIVPARGGSKGVPRKNARLLGGRPLLVWTAMAALAAERLDRVVLSTDDDELAAIGQGAGLDVPFLRPADLAGDATPMIAVVRHALDALGALGPEPVGERFDAVCLLQPTSPFRTAADIDGAVARLDDPGVDTVVSTLPIPAEHHPDWAYVVDDDGGLVRATAFGGGGDPPTRRQDLRPAVHREGSLYVARTRVIAERGSLYGDRVVGHSIDPARSVNIDTEADWARAEALLAEALQAEGPSAAETSLATP